jgi:hypothetical protein
LVRKYDNQKKVKCPGCGLEVRLRNNGTLNKHGYVHSRNGLAIRGNPCPMSGKSPRRSKEV